MGCVGLEQWVRGGHSVVRSVVRSGLRCVVLCCVHRRPMAAQQGFALVVVLLMLVVLSTASVALIQNQRLATRQAADRLEGLAQRSEADAAHEVCVQRLQSVLLSQSSDLGGGQAPLLGFVGGDALADLGDARWGSGGSACLYEWYGVSGDSFMDAGAVWTPLVRVNSRTWVNQRWQQRLTELRYSPCPPIAGSVAHCTRVVVLVKRSVDSLAQEMFAVFDGRQPVLSAQRVVH